jgi:acetylornithine deacetylase/succinyl-diaminopimelate desuccinylase-like protein
MSHSRKKCRSWGKSKQMRKIIIPALTLLLGAGHSLAQSGLEKVRAYRQNSEHQILAEYFDFLSIPNFALDKANIQRNAEFIAALLQRRGVEPHLLPSRTPGTPPAIYGEALVPGAKRTIVFYAHYDGQAVNPEQWDPDIRPYGPVFLTQSIEKGGKVLPQPKPGEAINPEWRISGRSSSDDKAGVMLILNAYDALVQSRIPPTSNIKFFFEGEEEIGSVHLGEIIEGHRELLRSDLWIIADGPVHQSGLPMLDFGVRGDVNMEITTYGPKRPLHSGHYGNWAPNPAQLLVTLLASMKDESGQVTVKGFYDDVIPFSAAEKKAMAEIPPVDDQLKEELGFIRPEGGGQTLYETYGYPSLNINGIRSADVGKEARNVIPAEATATLDLRQVLGTDFEKQIQRVIDHIKAQGFYVTDKDPTAEERQRYKKIAKVTSDKGGYNAQRTPIDLPISQSVIAAVKSAAGGPIVVAPTSGGSLPLYLIKEHLKAKVITLCIVNHDNNQHAENENVRIQNLWDSLEQLAAIMTMK